MPMYIHMSSKSDIICFAAILTFWNVPSYWMFAVILANVNYGDGPVPSNYGWNIGGGGEGGGG